MGIGSWLYSNSTKNLRVKIVHPGGHAELHDRPVQASEIIRRNPKCCVAHPNVFKQPWAIVQPDTMLMPGQKVYVVPISTVRKLQKLSIKRSLSSSGLIDREGESSKEDGEDDGVDSDISCCSVEDGDVSCGKSFNGGNNESNNNNKSCLSCVFTGSKRKTELKREVGSTSNIGGSSPKKLINSLDYWQPSLHCIVEEKSVSVIDQERSDVHGNSIVEK